MFTKPCERSDRGCDGLAKAVSLRELPKRRFCSTKCCYEHRRETGELPIRLTREQRQEFGRKGGLIGAAKRRRVAITMFAAEMTERIPESLLGKLTHREQLLLTALLTRTWERGRIRGIAYEKSLQRSFLEQARKQQAAA